MPGSVEFSSEDDGFDSEDRQVEQYAKSVVKNVMKNTKSPNRIKGILKRGKTVEVGEEGLDHIEVMLSGRAEQEDLQKQLTSGKTADKSDPLFSSFRRADEYFEEKTNENNLIDNSFAMRLGSARTATNMSELRTKDSRQTEVIFNKADRSSQLSRTRSSNLRSRSPNERT